MHLVQPEDEESTSQKKSRVYVTDGVLYRHNLHTLDFNDNDTADDWKLCVPTEQQIAVLEGVHDSYIARHLGVMKTLQRLVRHYYWPGMFQEAVRYLGNFLNCQAYKAQQQTKPGQMHATHVEQPWNMVSIDRVEPKSRSAKGNIWLLVMQGRFSKWVEVAALRKAE